MTGYDSRGARRAPYGFTCHFPGVPALSFDVASEAKPPRNVHVLAGRNDAGKTRVLPQIAGLLLTGPRHPADGFIEFRGTGSAASAPAGQPLFTGLVAVSFSPFGGFEPHIGTAGKTGYAYVGLRNPGSSRIKGSADLAEEFSASAQACARGARRPCPRRRPRRRARVP